MREKGNRRLGLGWQGRRKEGEEWGLQGGGRTGAPAEGPVLALSYWDLP